MIFATKQLVFLFFSALHYSVSPPVRHSKKKPQLAFFSISIFMHKNNINNNNNKNHHSQWLFLARTKHFYFSPLDFLNAMKEFCFIVMWLRWLYIKREPWMLLLAGLKNICLFTKRRGKIVLLTLFLLNLLNKKFSGSSRCFKFSYRRRSSRKSLNFFFNVHYWDNYFLN